MQLMHSRPWFLWMYNFAYTCSSVYCAYHILHTRLWLISSHNGQFWSLHLSLLLIVYLFFVSCAYSFNLFVLYTVQRNQKTIIIPYQSISIWREVWQALFFSYRATFVHFNLKIRYRQISFTTMPIMKNNSLNNFSSSIMLLVTKETIIIMNFNETSFAEPLQSLSCIPSIDIVRWRIQKNNELVRNPLIERL